ncbi:MAG: hypothetical protein HC938_02485 [Nitrospira sp.]|nr:hypothetical protein [Nitrospira sp.]
MKPSLVTCVLIAGFSLTTAAVSSAFPTDEPISVPQAALTPALDVVTLKDGSVIHGEVVEMVGGVLQMKSALADDLIKIKWSEVSKLTVSHPIPFHLKEGTVLVGTAEEGEPGTMKLKAGPTGSTMTMPMDAVTQVNPMIQPPVVYSGSLNAGYSQSVGNSHLRNVSILGDFVARSEQLRLTLLGRYVNGDIMAVSTYETLGERSSWTSLSRNGSSGSHRPMSKMIFSKSQAENSHRDWTGGTNSLSVETSPGCLGI